MAQPPIPRGAPQPSGLPGQEYVVANEPRGRRVLGEVAYGVGLTLTGILLIVLAAFVEGDPRGGTIGRIASLVVGVSLLATGIGLVLPYPRSSRRSQFVFSVTGLQLRTRVGTVFALPWTDIAGVSIEELKKAGPRGAYTGPHLVIDLAPGAERKYPQLRSFRRKGRYYFKFYEYPELRAQMAHACATFAGDKYSGVHS